MALDLSAKPKTTPPPAKRAAPVKRATAADEAKLAERQEGLNGLGQLASAGFMMAGQFANAQATAIHFPNIARETAILAARYESVGSAIDKLNSVGPFAGLITAVIPFALQLLVNFGRLEANGVLATQLGVMPKEALEAQGQAAAIRQLQAAMQEQERAERELAEARESLNGSRTPERV